MKLLKNCKSHSALLILVSYFILSIPILYTNTLSIIILKDYNLGMITQGSFYSGCIVGTLISPSIFPALSSVKVLIASTLFSVLYPIIYPISEIDQSRDMIVVVIILSAISGIGVAVYQLTHAWFVIKVQQSSKRNYIIGFQMGFLYIGGCVSGFLICIPEISNSGMDNWIMSLISGILALFTLGVILTIADEEIIISINQGITLNPSSYFLSYFSIGCFRVLCYGLIPYYMYSEIEESNTYILGIYLIFTSAAYFFGCIISGLSIRYKLEKFMLILCFLSGLFSVIPLIINIFQTDFVDTVITSILTSVFFSAQGGMLETFIVKIIAVNAKKPKLEMILLKSITSATTAGFFFAVLINMLNQFKRISPLLNRVVIKRFEAEKKSAGGIFLTGGSDKDNVGEVVSVGPGGYDDFGNFQPSTLKPGQKVLLPNYGGSVIEHNSQKFSIYKDSEILAVLE